jgi:anti-anti-sigma factor
VDVERTPKVPPIDFVVGQAHPAGLTLHVRGELDAGTAPHLRAALDGADAVTELVVDLSTTSFGDLRGVRELVRCARRRRARRDTFLVVAPPPSVEAILRLTPLGAELSWEPRLSRAGLAR